MARCGIFEMPRGEVASRWAHNLEVVGASPTVATEEYVHGLGCGQ